MADGKDRDRSVSGDFEDSDAESHVEGHDGPNPPGKPGRKKNPNSQAARRDQNRIAQREFRLRKQQRIRDLEARVELLSGGKDEAMDRMRSILKDLMAENQTLRNLLKSLSSFIGDGAGGLLPKLGWDSADFNNFVNRSETDTAWESFQKRKKSQPPPASASSAGQGSKRSAEEDLSTSRSKRSRGIGDQDKDIDRGPDYSLIVPLGASVPANNMYPTTRSSQDSGLFSELMRGSGGSPMFMQPSPPSATSTQFGAPATTLDNYQSSYMPPMSMNVETSLPPLSFPANGNTQPPVQRGSNPLTPDQGGDDDDPGRGEAYKLISYHLENYKRNSAYCLPSSLRPTLVQRTVPHESVIDRIPHPELRDRMILLRGRFDLVDCLMDYRTAVTIHGEDVLAHSNWEINEKWLRQYGYLVDQATLNISNRWRRERGEPEIRLSELVSQEPSA